LVPTSTAVLICLVIGIADGDTLTARCETRPGMQNVKVRLAEIDAHEKGQAFGTRSKQHLSDICFKESAELRVQGSDRYGRTVARVTCDRIDANAEQVRAGMAQVFDRYVIDRGLYALQSEAREARRGLWADASPVAPWEWRHTRRRDTLLGGGAGDIGSGARSRQSSSSAVAPGGR
jgi:endonuclease YncB( thermonuclease family)